MSTQSEITRLQTSRNKLRNKAVELGIGSINDKLDVLATEFDGIVNIGAVNVSVQEGESYTIPAGYHNGSGTVAGISGGGNYTLQAKTVTPLKQQQSISPDSGYYGLSAVTVEAIPDAYQDVTSVTATAADVLANKIIVDASGTTIPGTMPNIGAQNKTLDATANNQEVTISKGYHSGLGKVTIVLETKTVTPTKSAQDITPTAGKVLSKVTVAAIPDEYQDVSGVTAAAGDVLADKVIVDANGENVTGSMVNNGAVDKTLDASASNQSYTVPSGFHNGSGKVKIVLEEKSATPTKSTQNITPTNGKVLSKVTVNPIPANYITTTDADAAAGDILAPKTAYVNSVKVTGTMANNGAISGEIDGLSVMSYTVPAGYTSGGTVSLTDDIEDALAAI